MIGQRLSTVLLAATWTGPPLALASIKTPQNTRIVFANGIALSGKFSEVIRGLDLTNKKLISCEGKQNQGPPQDEKPLCWVKGDIRFTSKKVVAKGEAAEELQKLRELGLQSKNINLLSLLSCRYKTEIQVSSQPTFGEVLSCEIRVDKSKIEALKEPTLWGLLSQELQDLSSDFLASDSDYSCFILKQLDKRPGPLKDGPYCTLPFLIQIYPGHWEWRGQPAQRIFDMINRLKPSPGSRQNRMIQCSKQLGHSSEARPSHTCRVHIDGLFHRQKDKTPRSKQRS